MQALPAHIDASTTASTDDGDRAIFFAVVARQVKLVYLGHVLMENHNGLLVQTFLTEANARAEGDAAMLMAEACRAVRRKLGLRFKTGKHLRILGYIVGKELQDYKATEFDILSLVDHAHPAAAELLDDVVMRNNVAEERILAGHVQHNFA